MKPIQMVDLRGQYEEIKQEVDFAIDQVIENSSFIRGPFVDSFERELAAYLGGRHAIGVANGTDALQIAMMACGIGPGDEVITPDFTFIATAEAAALLGATPVFVDIDPHTFNLDVKQVERAITSRTKAIIPVHLFGQAADMDPLMDLATRHNLMVIEDNAQAIGSEYKGRKTGFIGNIGCLSFFPSKNLGAYGDAGAILTNDDELAAKMRMIANHGSSRKYYNEIVGVNSRLDTLQAAILRVKLRRLDDYAEARQRAADRYDRLLKEIQQVTLPGRHPDSTHVFHQYTIRVSNEKGGRDSLARFLKEKGIPTAVYYPFSLHNLPVFKDAAAGVVSLVESEKACQEVLSLPMHTELGRDQQEYIAESIRSFFAT